MTKGNFGKLLGILLKTTVHLQLSLLSLLPFLRAKHNGHSLMKQKQTVYTITLSLFLLLMMKTLYYLLLKNLQTIHYQQ